MSINKKLYEGLFDDLVTTTSGKENNAQSVFSIGSGSKKKRAGTSKDKIKTDTVQEKPKIKKVKTVQEEIFDTVSDTAKITKEKTEKKSKKTKATDTVKSAAKKKRNKQEKPVPLIVQQTTQPQSAQQRVQSQIIPPTILQQTPQQLTTELEEVVSVLEEENNISLDNVNVEHLVETTSEALEEIPFTEDVSIEDLEVKPSKVEKTKDGYYKTKVSIKKEGIPQIINDIASAVKKLSKGVIKPRVCDLRVIGNTNKTQLRSSELKLSVNTVVFKPNKDLLKVNKGTRIMVSVPAGHSSTGELLIYIQESRSKVLLPVSIRDAENEEEFVKHIAAIIANYYTVGYDVTYRKLLLRGKDSPLIDVIHTAVATKEYKAKTYSDTENHVYAVDFISNSDKNQWLRVQLREAQAQGLYEVYALNTVSGDEYKLMEPVSINKLLNNIISILNQTYERDWSTELAETGMDEIYYNIGKLKHFKLRKILTMMYEEISETDNQVGLEVLKTLSRKDMIKLQRDDYDAEAIIGKTKYCSFILTYLAIPIEAGDSRSGNSYITSQRYYQKYSVNDRSAYTDRKRTIYKKEGKERNYNARPYMFQLEYQIDGVTYKYLSRTYLDVVETTKFLTQTPSKEFRG